MNDGYFDKRLENVESELLDEMELKMLVKGYIGDILLIDIMDIIIYFHGMFGYIFDGNILDRMKNGETLLKYGKFGKPKYKTFQLTKDNKSLIWFSAKKSINDTTIYIENIRKILIGDKANLNKSTKKNRDVVRASFTIYYGDPNTKLKDLKTLTVTAKNERIGLVWANGLKILANV